MCRDWKSLWGLLSNNSASGKALWALGFLFVILWVLSPFYRETPLKRFHMCISHIFCNSPILYDFFKRSMVLVIIHPYHVPSYPALPLHSQPHVNILFHYSLFLLFTTSFYVPSLEVSPKSTLFNFLACGHCKLSTHV